MNELLFQFYKILTHGIMGIFFTCLTLIIRHLLKKRDYKKKLKIVEDRCKKLGINGSLYKALSSKNDTILELLDNKQFKDKMVKLVDKQLFDYLNNIKASPKKKEEAENNKN